MKKINRCPKSRVLYNRFIDSFLYLIENSDFCTKFGPFLDPFPAKSPNSDLKRKFGPLWQQCLGIPKNPNFDLSHASVASEMKILHISK